MCLCVGTNHKCCYIHSITISSQRSREVNIDNRPESVVRVKGASVHALFNFLLTSKTTITTTGSHAGIPPTILAPVAFKGGTLKVLKVQAVMSSLQSHCPT